MRPIGKGLSSEYYERVCSGRNISRERVGGRLREAQAPPRQTPPPKIHASVTPTAHAAVNKRRHPTPLATRGNARTCSPAPRRRTCRSPGRPRRPRPRRASTLGCGFPRRPVSDAQHNEYVPSRRVGAGAVACRLCCITKTPPPMALFSRPGPVPLTSAVPAGVLRGWCDRISSGDGNGNLPRTLRGEWLVISAEKVSSETFYVSAMYPADNCLSQSRG